MNHRAWAWGFLSIFLISGLSAAQNEEIKARFLQRLPALTGLKNDGIIGENNLGFLEFRNPAQKNEENEKLVSAENADRQQVYNQIAQKTGASAQDVGKRRALQIAEKAAKGHWLQDDTGRWHQKQ